MSAAINKKRKRLDSVGRKHVSKSKKLKRVAAYHSSSEDERDPGENHFTVRKGKVVLRHDDDGKGPADEEVQLPNLIQEKTRHQEENVSSDDYILLDNGDDDDENGSGATSDSEIEGSDDESLGASSSNLDRKPRKRNDPTAFATSISRILNSKLTASKRVDPVLSRSKEASDTAKDLAESRLEAKAKRKLREEKKTLLDRSHVTDVLGLESTEMLTGEVAELERSLKKTAQRGVVKLFNAVRAAQVKGEEAAREVRNAGTVGADRRQERVNEMSKKGFLDLLVEGSKK